MAVIRDMMPDFELYQPTTIADAVALLGRYGKDGWALGGGMDTFDWLKDRVKRVKAVIDLSGIEELRGIRPTEDGGIEIGAMTTLTEVATHPDIRERYWVLAEAARRVASPQIRNQATIGGNVCQDARCWYYRGGLPCYRAGGNTCFADTPTAINREHCLFGADRCVAVNPSDTAPALIALDAKMVIVNSRGERVVDAEDFWIGPSVDITRMTILAPGDLMKAIRIPATWANAEFYFEKVSDRKSWDFPLVNVAAAKVVRDGRIERIRLAVNAVSAKPMRLVGVEESVIGEPVNEDTAEMAGQAAVWGARPLNYNHFKVPLMKNLVKRAIRGVEA